MTYGHKLAGWTAEDLETARADYGAILQRVVDEAFPGAPLAIELGTIRFSLDPAVLVTVPVGRITLRVAIVERVFGSEPKRDVAQMLVERIADAQRWEERLVARLDDVRTKLEPCLARHGGFKLLSLQLEADRIDLALNWHKCGLEAAVETLDQMLQPKVKVISGFTAREMAGTIRLLGKDQVRRQRMRDRLAAAGAALEIDLAAEEVIARRGGRLSEVVAALLADADLPARSAAQQEWPELGMVEGLIFFDVPVGRSQVRRYVTAQELAAA